MKPFSEACEQNKQPILDVIREYFSHSSNVLEIGSGTGQHAVFFAKQLPHLIWHCSDRREHHEGIQQWLDEYQGDNIAGPYELDVTSSAWPTRSFDAIFSANTTHIMSWTAVEKMFIGLAGVLEPGGIFCLYGPFNYHGSYTSASNEQFDQYLKMRDPLSGIRDVADLYQLASRVGLEFIKDHEMPVNNRILVWQKT